MEEKRRIAIGAALEGESMSLKNSGKKTKVSDLELFVLCNLARIGFLSMFSDLDGEIGQRSQEELVDFLTAIQRVFDVNKLLQSGVALIHAGRFEKWVIPNDMELPERQR
jgi:hypothetical protein